LGFTEFGKETQAALSGTLSSEEETNHLEVLIACGGVGLSDKEIEEKITSLVKTA
jgi:hypothetical protein